MYHIEIYDIPILHILALPLAVNVIPLFPGLRRIDRRPNVVFLSQVCQHRATGPAFRTEYHDFHAEVSSR